MAHSPRIETPNAVRWCIASVALAAVAFFGVALVVDSGRTVPDRPNTLLLAATLVLAGALTQRFPLHLTYQSKVDVGAAVLVATILLLDVPTAIAVAVAVTAVDALVVHRPRRVSWDTWEELIFNTAQTALSVGVGGAAYHLLADSRLPRASRPRQPGGGGGRLSASCTRSTRSSSPPSAP